MLSFDQRKPIIDGYITVLDSLVKNDKLEGHIFSHPEMIWKQKNLYQLAQNSSRILEIGFNAGHSSILLLVANPLLELYCFDIATHTYIDKCFNFISSQFPGRIHLIKGDSRVTVPKFAADNKNLLFDGFHVDGCHSPEVAMQDLDNCYLLAQKYAWVVFDDTDYSALAKLWEQYLQQRKIKVLDLASNKLFSTVKFLHGIGRYTLDWEWYLQRYPDLTAAGIKDKAGAYHHWLHHGNKEQRAPNSSYAQ